MVKRKTNKKRNKQEKSKFSLYNLYKANLSFLWDSRNYILFTCIIFLISLLVGFIFPSFGQEYIAKWIEGLLKETEGFGFIDFFLFILQNNTLVSLASIVLGFFFSIFPFFTLVFNGYVIGLVMRISLESSAFGLFELWRLFPHGVFEIPAVLISIALGIRLGSFILNEKPFERFKFLFINSLKIFIFIILPLLIIAALIEAGLIVLLK